MSPLAVKIIRDDGNTENEKDFQSIKVLGRCLELLDVDKNRIPVVTFLRCGAPLFGHQLKSHWDVKLAELSKFLDQENTSSDSTMESEKILIWEDRLVEFLEESVNLEGESWGLKLADEIASKIINPSLAVSLSAVAITPEHVGQLVELARLHSSNLSGQTLLADEFARAVGICSKRHLDVVLNFMEEACTIEDARKRPVRLLGLVRDFRAAANNEAAKVGLLKSYGEIAKRAEAAALFPALDKYIFTWIIRQLNESKDNSTKEAGLIAIEQVCLFVFNY